MLKKTLHTAIAAIAVSTMCLPTAEAAKKDLLLDFESAKSYLTSTSVMGPNPSGNVFDEPVLIYRSTGVLDFDGKVIDADFAMRVGFDQSGEGQHSVCGIDSDVFFPVEISMILRGGTPANTLTLDTVSMEDSMDLLNPSAAVLCVSSDGGSSVLTAEYQITGATGKWSCSSIVGDSLSFYDPNEAQPPERPFRAYVSPITRSLGEIFTGSILINRTTCQQ